jgi:hypothetical protein
MPISNPRHGRLASTKTGIPYTIAPVVRGLETLANRANDLIWAALRANVDPDPRSCWSPGISPKTAGDGLLCARRTSMTEKPSLPHWILQHLRKPKPASLLTLRLAQQYIAAQADALKKP